MCDIYLPNEIIILILDKIDDTNTYKNSRLVCKYWYNILKDGKIFKDNIVDRIIQFYTNKIEFYNKKKLLIGQVHFSNYGFYEYKKFNNNCVISIKSTPLELSYTKNIGTYYESKQYNIMTDKKIVREHYLPNCVIM